MKILLAVPTFETIYPDTFKSLWELERGGNEVIFDFVRGYDCAAARNNIIQRALKENVDYVFMVDNDMVLPKDALITLLSNNKDVCYGYCARRPADNIYDGNSSIFKLGEYNFENRYTIKELLDYKNQGQYLIEIHGGGAACILIKMEVFKCLQYPWFDWVNYKNKSNLSEDLYFCSQCKKANIPMYVDTRVGCGHIMRYIQWPT